LHMIIHGFIFETYKPDHEHHLQVVPHFTSLVLLHLQGLKSYDAKRFQKETSSDK
jgi:hypothetical protein